MTQELAPDRIFFDVLPVEIIKEILCYLEYEDLCPLKLVCSNWKGRIEEILQIENVPVSKERFEDATNIFREWYNGCRRFHMYRAQYSIKNMISPTYINKQTTDYIYTISNVEYTKVLELLQWHSKHGGAYSDRSEDPVGATWRTVLAMTESNYSVDGLRDKDFNDECVKSFMEKYKWYTYRSGMMMGVAWDAGFIALYPDLKTFSVVFGTDTD